MNRSGCRKGAGHRACLHPEHSCPTRLLLLPCRELGLVREGLLLDVGSLGNVQTGTKRTSGSTTHTHRHAGKAEAPEPILPAGIRLLTPCFTVLAACAAFFFASYGVRMSIMAMKYTSFLGAPSKARELLAHPELSAKPSCIPSLRNSRSAPMQTAEKARQGELCKGQRDDWKPHARDPHTHSEHCAAPQASPPTFKLTPPADRDSTGEMLGTVSLSLWTVLHSLWLIQTTGCLQHPTILTVVAFHGIDIN